MTGLRDFLHFHLFQVQVGSTLFNCNTRARSSIRKCTVFAIAISGLSKVVLADIMYMQFLNDLAEHCMHFVINKVKRWAEMRGFRFTTLKAMVVHFRWIKGFHPDPGLYLEGQSIPCVEKICFLGLIFDCRMTWVPLIWQLKIKCSKDIDVMKVLFHTSGGAD